MGDYNNNNVQTRESDRITTTDMEYIGYISKSNSEVSRSTFYKSESETLVNEGRDGDGLGIGLWGRLRYGGMYGVSHRRSMFGVSHQRSMFGVWVWEFSGDECRRLCPLTWAAHPQPSVPVRPSLGQRERQLTAKAINYQGKKAGQLQIQMLQSIAILDRLDMRQQQGGSVTGSQPSLQRRLQ